MRRVLIGAGLATAAVGLTAVFAPEVLGISMTSLAVTVLGGLMLLHAATSITGEDPSLDQAEPGDPEQRRAMPRPGDEADAMIAGFDGTNDGPIRHRRRIREWVTDAAVSVISHVEGISETEARERIRDEVYAARRELEVIADLDRESPDDEAAARLRRLRRLARWRRTGESPLQEKLRRAVNAIGRRFDMPDLDDEEAYPADPGAVFERLDPPTRGDSRREPRFDERRTEVFDGVYRKDHRETGHWMGAVALSFAFGGAGVLTEQPPLLLAAAVGIGFAAYASYADSAGATVAIERSLAPERPRDGEETTVTLTVRNVGDGILPDVRVVDGVPERLEVTAGVPRFGTALRPDEEATFEYDVTAQRGVHEFEDVTVISRDASGAIEDELVIEAEAELRCVPALRTSEVPMPLRDLAAGFAGEVAAEPGGGVEFYAVREYRPGDPLNRIDWNRHARTGDLATLEFREERSTTVFLLIDARAEAYLAPDDGEHAVDRSVTAAGQLYTAFTSASNPTGIASFGPERCWIEASLGHSHEHRVEEALGSHPAFSPLPPADRKPTLSWLKDVRRRLPPESQVVFVSPLCDEFAPFVARRLEAFGHPVTVLSPDPTAQDTVGARLAWIRRTVRVLDLRSAGIPVIDWEWDTPLEAVLRQESSRRYP